MDKFSFFTVTLSILLENLADIGLNALQNNIRVDRVNELPDQVEFLFWTSVPVDTKKIAGKEFQEKFQRDMQIRTELISEFRAQRVNHEKYGLVIRVNKPFVTKGE